MGIDADMFNSPEWMSEALRIGNTGLWAIEIDEENGKHRMTANETMLLLLGLETHPSPEDCFRHWYGRVDEAYRAAVDECVDRVVKAVLDNGGRAFVTADHGNADQMVDPETGEPFTAHTTNPVPFIAVGPEMVGKKLREGGRLADIAPTMLHSMGIPVPAEMTGKSLIVE